MQEVTCFCRRVATKMEVGCSDDERNPFLVIGVSPVRGKALAIVEMEVWGGWGEIWEKSKRSLSSKNGDEGIVFHILMTPSSSHAIITPGLPLSKLVILIKSSQSQRVRSLLFL